MPAPGPNSYVASKQTSDGHSIEILVNATRNAEAFYAALGYERCVEHPAPSTLLVVMKKALTP